MSHRTLTTAAAVVVNHTHPDQTYELTATEKASYHASALASYPGIQPVEYVRLNHVSEVLLPTRRYNCWGFTFNPRQCWISSGTDVQNILNGNGTQVSAPNLRVGDVICYRDPVNTITHTGRVWSLGAGGQPALIQSKWGSLGEYLHPPLTVPLSYGTNVTYWRVTPLAGKGDGWHQDNAADDRLPYSPGICWLSPDLWCNNSGGTTHQDPLRGQPNQLYARLHNPDTLALDGSVRFYWADPNGGIPHSEWNSIGTAPAAVAPGATVVVGPVTWTPGPTAPAHSCLLAIADLGDDPFAAATQDPIVWPFEVWRDNNIVQRNVAVITLPPGPPPPLPFTTGNPLGIAAPVQVQARLAPLVRADVKLLGIDPGALGPLADQLPERAAPRPRPGMRLEIVPEKGKWRTGGTLVGKGLTFKMARVPPGRHERLVLKPAALKAGPAIEGYRLDVVQRVAGVVTGGMTYVFVVKRG